MPQKTIKSLDKNISDEDESLNFKVEETNLETKPNESQEAGISSSTTENKPKITSFSQLGSNVAGEATKNETRIITEELVPKKEPEEEEENKIGSQINKDEGQELVNSSKIDSESENKPEGEEKLSSEDIKNWLKDIRPDTTKEIEKGSKSFFKSFLLIFIFLILAGGLVGGIIYYKKGVNKKSSETTDKISTQEELTPTPTPIPTKVELEISKYTLSILNGSGIAGEAKGVADILKEAGFSEAKTGNADRYDYISTSVSLKESVPEEVFNKIKDILSDTYTLERSKKSLEESSLYDIIIIVGKKK